MRVPGSPRSVSLIWRYATSLVLLGSSALAQVEAARARVEARGATRQLKVEGLDQPLSELKLTDFDGRDLTDVLQPRAADGQVQVALARPMQFVVKSRAIQTHSAPAGGERMTLPGGVVVPVGAPGDGSTAGRSAWFRLTFAASPMPAPWNADSAEYVTQLTFGLRRPAQLPADVALERPVIVKLGYEGLTAQELPAIAIEAAGLEHEKTVELRFQPRTPGPKLLVRSTISDVNLELGALARLEVRPQQRTMLGYGLETVTIVIESVLAHGEPSAVARATPVAVELDGGARLEAEELALAPGQASTMLRIRSAGVGRVTIGATAGGLHGRATIEQRFPTGPLLAAVLGGALGGCARRFVKGARRGRAVRHAIEGTIVGLLAFVAGVLGVGYLALPAGVVATEAGAFLVGALTGFVGVSVIAMLGKKQSRAAA